MYALLRPFLFRLEAEQAHRLGMRAARLAQATAPSLVARTFEYEADVLRQSLWGLDVPNPVGLAAGFDKNAELVPFWAALGFGFAEVGSVSAKAAAGNPRPRAFRLPADQALVNRMGLNNDGALSIAARLATRPTGRPLGVNLAKTHDPAILGDATLDDFRESFHLLAPHADYVALNISCPNTTEGKTFEDPASLDALLQTIFEERAALALDVPVLVKLSPPASDPAGRGQAAQVGSEMEEVIAVSRAHGVAGFIATNTASDRRGLRTSGQALEQMGRGGLSGRPLAERSTALVRWLYEHTEGAVPIIGVGGVASAEAAYAKIRAGASLVQLYTGLVYEGPGLVRQIKRGLARLLLEDGFASVREAVGADVRAPDAARVALRSDTA
ncbi:MAG: quinone-dependent dihydroorotate dehydrogenase [Rhodothermales bacterium]